MRTGLVGSHVKKRLNKAQFDGRQCTLMFSPLVG